MNAKRYGAALVAALLAVGVAARGDDIPEDTGLYEGANHKFHARLKLDAAKKQATVWILDGKAKKLVPIKAKTIAVVLKGVDPIKLNAVPDKADAAMASRFAGNNDRFGGKIKYEDVQLRINIDGKKEHTFTFDAD